MAQQISLSPRGARTDWSNIALRWGNRHARLIAPLITLVAEVIFFTWRTDTFMTKGNMLNVITQIGPVAVAAAGVTFVLLCAEIDLSIASTATLAGVIGAWLWVNDLNVDHLGVGFSVHLGTWGILVAVIAAVAIGFINGYLSSYVGIPSFMMTLAMLTIAHGMSVYITQGKPIFKSPALAHYLGSAGSR